MSETMSNPTEWMQFYNQNFSGQPQASTTTQPTILPDRVSDATAVTAAVTGSASPTAPNRLSPEGRVSKPVRRRTRASRRTPTTLLNTDTTNFRAMVQQFTGGPSAPFASAGSHPGASAFAFGLGARQGSFANPSAVMVPAAQAGNYHHTLHLHQQNMYHHQRQNQQYMFAGGGSGGAGNDSFFQRLSSGRPVVSNMGVGNINTTEGFLNTVGSQAVAPAAAATATARPSSNSPNEDRSNSFLY